MYHNGNYKKDSIDAPEMVRRVLPLLRHGRLDELAGLYAADGVHEWPFAPPGSPAKVVGRTAIEAHFRDVLSGLPLVFDSIEVVTVCVCEDTGTVMVEADARGRVTANDQEFMTRYVWTIRVVDGLIQLWRDYMNPMDIPRLLASAGDVA